LGRDDAVAGFERASNADKASKLDVGMMDELKEYFGLQGKSPAGHIESGKLCM
jgi:hypothetical protein